MIKIGKLHILWGDLFAPNNVDMAAHFRIDALVSEASNKVVIIPNAYPEHTVLIPVVDCEPIINVVEGDDELAK